MEQMDYNELMEFNPTMLEEFINQLGQEVKIYEDPECGDEGRVICAIGDKAAVTEFFDTGDFHEGSCYNPCLNVITGVILEHGDMEDNDAMPTEIELAKKLLEDAGYHVLAIKKTGF